MSLVSVSTCCTTSLFKERQIVFVEKEVHYSSEEVSDECEVQFLMEGTGYTTKLELTGTQNNLLAMPHGEKWKGTTINNTIMENIKQNK